MQRLKSLYINEVIPEMKLAFGYSNSNQVPKIKKIIINRGFDESCQANKTLDVFINEFKLISGQYPILTRAKKAISNFKVKENMVVGMCVTLRGDNMYSFLDRLVNLSLPRIRDFRGLSKKSFDRSGNYTIGLTEQLMFPEIEFDKVVKLQGMDISIVTNCSNNEESYFLLKKLGIPFN